MYGFPKMENSLAITFTSNTNHNYISTELLTPKFKYAVESKLSNFLKH